MVATIESRGRMRLVPDEYEHRPERRVFGRKEAHCQADAWRLDNTLSALRQPRMQLQVRDISLNGMCALTTQPVAKGEHVSVSFPAADGFGPWDAYGRIVRCEGSAMGYRVAVEFDPRPAA